MGPLLQLSGVGSRFRKPSDEGDWPGSSTEDGPLFSTPSTVFTPSPACVPSAVLLPTSVRVSFPWPSTLRAR